MTIKSPLREHEAIKIMHAVDLINTRAVIDFFLA